MRNTGIIYSSTEKTPAVLPELAGLLPPLTGICVQLRGREKRRREE